MNKRELDELLQFLYNEIIERRDYSASKAFEVVIDKIKEIQDRDTIARMNERLRSQSIQANSIGKKPNSVNK